VIWVLFFLGCDEVSAEGQGPEGDPPSDDTAADTAGGEEPCPEPGDVVSSSDAEGRVGNWEWEWENGQFVTAGPGAPVEVFAWGFADGLEGFALFPQEEVLSDDPEPTWLLPVNSSESQEYRVLSGARARDDLDGDGLPDLLFGFVDGEVRLLPGPLTTVTTLDAFAFRVMDAAVLSRGSLGDTTGDGQADFSVGTYSLAAIFEGSSTGEHTYASAAATITFEGRHAGAVPRLTAARDHDGDGIDDVLVSTFAWSGLFVGPLDGSLSEADADAVFDGEGPQGYRTVGTGDVDGDGYPDVFVGAPYADVVDMDAAGQAWVFAGPARGAVDFADAVAHVVGERASLNLGEELTSLRSPSGFGSDLVVNASAMDCYMGVGNDCTSAVAAVYRFAAPVAGELDAACATTTWESAEGDLFGHSIEADVDADGSGLPDLLVSGASTVVLFMDP
jgi:hypothetical protein